MEEGHSDRRWSTFSAAPLLGSRISPFPPTDGAAALHVKWVKGERKVTAADRRRPAGKHRSYSNTPLQPPPPPTPLSDSQSAEGGGFSAHLSHNSSEGLTGGVEEVMGSGQWNGSTCNPACQCAGLNAEFVFIYIF